jgi:hypothetical protein
MTHGAQALEIGRGGDCSRRRASWLHERRRARVERRDRRGRAAGIEEASAIAEEAYIYGLPLVMNYAAMYDMAVNRDSGQFKAPFNEISSEARVFTPDDTAVIVPNSDTPYSMLSLDLRAERMVLSVPAVEKGRYYSVQLCDANTFNYGYIGSRATGNDPRTYDQFLAAGPSLFKVARDSRTGLKFTISGPLRFL